MSVYQRFHPRLQRAIVDRLHWRGLHPVQELTAEALLDGHNAIVLAPTAGGKTEAAMFPVLSQLLADPPAQAGVQCLYIAPLRALLNNQQERLSRYAEMLGLRAFKWHGEAARGDKQAFLREPCELLMTTPESLEAMLISQSFPAKHIFAPLRFVVIDEIHALAGCERGAQLICLLERLRHYADADFQRVGLSATVGNAEAMLSWLQGSSRHPGLVIDPPRPPGKKLLEVKRLDEIELAIETGRRARGRRSLFFTDSRRRAEAVSQALAREQVDVQVHHSSIARSEREAAEQKLAQGRNVAIVCTSTLELGIDVGELDLIFQAEAPATVAAFLQRMGRTGRRPDTVANTTFMCTQDESMLQAIALIELARARWVEDVRLDEAAWHILVHQLMAMCLEFGALRRMQAWQTLSAAACFRQIDAPAFHSLIDFLISEDYLSEESGLLSMGLKAEQTFGRKHFLELCAVFSSPVSYQVIGPGGQMLGAIDWQFAESVGPGNGFLLAGQAWRVARIGHAEKTLWVEPAPGGKAPKWGATTPTLLSERLCRTIRDVLVDEREYPFCDLATRKQLHALRQERLYLANDFAPLQVEEQEMTWWTYAGGRINKTLRLALSRFFGCEIVSNQLSLRFVETVLNEASLREALAAIASPDWWQDQANLAALLQGLPEQRLSKFQPCLPEHLQRQLLAREYLDPEATRAFLTRYLA